MYKLISDSIVLRLVDNAFIPFSLENSDYVAYLSWLEEGNVPAPIDHPAETIPDVVSAAQGGMALIRMNLMQAVLDVVNSPDTPAEVRWAFDKAIEWNRYSDAFQYLAVRAGISETTQKDLFKLAATLAP